MKHPDAHTETRTGLREYNAGTSAILQYSPFYFHILGLSGNRAQDRNEIKASEIAQVENDGVTRKQRNGPTEQEKLSAQHRNWKDRKSTLCFDQLTSF